MKKILLILILISNFTYAQDLTATKYTANNKGKFFVYWGGNRESYTKSDINFSGKNYNFTVENATANDKPKGWHIDYFNPARMTIPQTNFRLGYFISNKYAVSIGIDHMKYVMNQNQTAAINGFVNLDSNNPAAIHNGIYNGNSKVLTEDFLTFEHTDGLNYVNAEMARYDDISKWIGLPNTDKFQINTVGGMGIGFLYPKTNAQVLSKIRYDDYHISGYGVSAKVGLNFTFFKHFFIQTELKGGYINLPDVKTTFDDADVAKHEFMFLQRIITIGGIFRV